MKSVTTKKPVERICMLEELPRPEWFVKLRTPEGQTQWFVRMSITGLRTRLYGPFANKQTCLFFLDAAINTMIDGVMEMADVQDKYQLPNRTFQNRGGHYPIIERELLLHARALPSQKRARVSSRSQRPLSAAKQAL